MDGAVVYECYAVNKQALSDSRLSLITYGLYIEVPNVVYHHAADAAGLHKPSCVNSKLLL